MVESSISFWVFFFNVGGVVNNISLFASLKSFSKKQMGSCHKNVVKSIWEELGFPSDQMTA